MNIKYKKSIFFVIFLILLIFLKIDFRFSNSIFCCSDDFDYYIHAETISEDFDLNYENQLKGLEDTRYNSNSKVAPIGYIGTGILSAPFMFIGNLIESLTGNFFESSDLMNYKLLVYSFSPIFYLFAGCGLIYNTLNILNIRYKNIELLLIFLGSGVSYYAFERFSMTHSYETFATSLTLYWSAAYYSGKKTNLATWLIPLSILIGLTIKWTNYYLLLIPVIIKLLSKSENRLITEKKFIISTVSSICLFLGLSYQVYGIITIDPRVSYQVQNSIVDLANTNLTQNFVLAYIDRIFTIFVSFEFGILYFMPVLAATMLFSFFVFLKNIVKHRKIDYLHLTYLLSCFQLIFIVAMWRSTASSYGFRYLMGIYPLAILLYYQIRREYNVVYFHKIILTLSFLSILSVLFFETTPETQLSLERIFNSFGKFTKYTQPTYLTGFLGSFFVFESYLKIFTTSFLGALIFKILLMLLGRLDLINLLESLGLPVGNEDFNIYINNLDTIGFNKFLVTIIFTGCITFYIYRLLNNKNYQT